MNRPSASSTPDVQGRAAAVESELSTTAPRKAPTAPGRATIRTVRQSMLPNRQCEMPDTRVVPTSARCTDAEAIAGVTPVDSRRVVLVTP